MTRFAHIGLLSGFRRLSKTRVFPTHSSFGRKYASFMLQKLTFCPSCHFVRPRCSGISIHNPPYGCLTENRNRRQTVRSIAAIIIKQRMAGYKIGIARHKFLFSCSRNLCVGQQTAADAISQQIGRTKRRLGKQTEGITLSLLLIIIEGSPGRLCNCTHPSPTEFLFPVPPSAQNRATTSFAAMYGRHHRATLTLRSKTGAVVRNR